MNASAAGGTITCPAGVAPRTNGARLVSGPLESVKKRSLGRYASPSRGASSRSRSASAAQRSAVEFPPGPDRQRNRPGVEARSSAALSGTNALAPDITTRVTLVGRMREIATRGRRIVTLLLAVGQPSHSVGFTIRTSIRGTETSGTQWKTYGSAPSARAPGERPVSGETGTVAGADSSGAAP